MRCQLHFRLIFFIVVGKGRRCLLLGLGTLGVRRHQEAWAESLSAKLCQLDRPGHNQHIAKTLLDDMA